MSKSNEIKIFPIKLIFSILILMSLIKSSYSFCNLDNCPKQRGICSNDGQCICNKNYITVDNYLVNSNGMYCNYHLKSRYIALILEFFFPFGVGHFNSGKTLLAFLKLALFVFLVCGFCSLLCCIVGKVLSAVSYVLLILIILSIIGLVIWEIFDLLGYGFGMYTDGNGVNMS